MSPTETRWWYVTRKRQPEFERVRNEKHDRAPPGDHAPIAPVSPNRRGGEQPHVSSDMRSSFATIQRRKHHAREALTVEKPRHWHGHTQAGGGSVREVMSAHALSEGARSGPWKKPRASALDEHHRTKTRHRSGPAAAEPGDDEPLEGYSVTPQETWGAAMGGKWRGSWRNQAERSLGQPKTKMS